MTIEQLVDDLRRRLSESVDPAFREGEVRFFREVIDPYGVRSADVKRLIPPLYRDMKQRPAAERNHLCELLWKSGKFEEGAIAVYLYRRFRRQCGAAEFGLFERWIDRYVHNWAHADGVASWLLAASIDNEPALISRLPGWTQSKNRWKRRSAAVALLQEAKAGRHTQDVLRISELLIEDCDDMVQKGLGWLLKEAYPRQPEKVAEYLMRRKDRAPRLVLRIAAEKMTGPDRAAILS